MSYVHAVFSAGGTPVIIPPARIPICDLIPRFDAFILSGGDDPVTEPFGVPTHPAAVPVYSKRQHLETQLLRSLADHPEKPVLGICLGMQMMGLVAGGTLNQHLPDTHTTHSDHWEHEHPIISLDESILPSGTIHSKHRQAMQDPGSLRVLATAHDGVIEAIDDPDRRFYLGVQWHPERTANEQLGQDIIDKLVAATLP